MQFSLFENRILGFSVAVTPQHLFYCFAGVFIGTLSRVLPGSGPVAAIAMLLMSATAASSPPRISATRCTRSPRVSLGVRQLLDRLHITRALAARPS